MKKAGDSRNARETARLVVRGVIFRAKAMDL
jgi:hypothetical protein